MAKTRATKTVETLKLVDGEQLAQLMIDHSVGVSVGETIKLVKLDEDYFLEE